MMPNGLFTIGHSDHSSEKLIELLRRHGISVLADVRSAPYSKWNAQFNKDAISAELKQHGIRYVFLGAELGDRRQERDCYVGPKAKYELIARLPLFRQGLERLQRGAAQHRIALMCAEKDPITCHRAILICRHMRKMELPIQHILETGDLESHEELESRLLALAGLPEQDLFQTREELVEQAYDWQGDRIAFEEIEKLPASSVA